MKKKNKTEKKTDLFEEKKSFIWISVLLMLKICYTKRTAVTLKSETKDFLVKLLRRFNHQ